MNVSSIDDFAKKVLATLPAKADKVASELTNQIAINLRPITKTGEVAGPVSVANTDRGPEQIERTVTVGAAYAEAVEHRRPYARPAADAVAARLDSILNR